MKVTLPKIITSLIRHIDLFVVLGGIVVGGIVGWTKLNDAQADQATTLAIHGTDISAIKENDIKRDSREARMDYNIQIIAQKVGVIPLTPPAN